MHITCMLSHYFLVYTSWHHVKGFILYSVHIPMSLTFVCAFQYITCMHGFINAHYFLACTSWHHVKKIFTPYTSQCHWYFCVFIPIHSTCNSYYKLANVHMLECDMVSHKLMIVGVKSLPKLSLLHTLWYGKLHHVRGSKTDKSKPHVYNYTYCLCVYSDTDPAP